MSGAHIAEIRREIIADEDPDPSYLEQEGFEERLTAYRRGDFAFVGVRAVAEIHIPWGEKLGGSPHVAGKSGSWIRQTIESPGLWGIEDDSGDEYLDEVYADELVTLRAMLVELGISGEAFAEARS